MRRITVSEYEAGLLYVDGRYQRTLGPGRYWETGLLARRQIVVVDLRLRSFSITGQELVTRDKVNIRMTVAVQYRVADPVKAIHEVQSYQDVLYQDIQLPLRGLIAQLELEALLETRDSVDQQLLEQVQPGPRSYGLELVKVGLKDIILPGELRATMQRVVEAKKAAEAALVTAREEVATARARQNVAAMLRDNPGLLELLRLEAMKEMAKARGNTFILNGPPAPPPIDGHTP
jgi:regulator of protease activity HflC (stomatin/prohibitin superfamily)